MTTHIKIRHRGPMSIKGDFQITDAEGNEIKAPVPDQVMLCRCGASSNKPFCDGTHYKTDFEASK